MPHAYFQAHLQARIFQFEPPTASIISGSRRRAVVFGNESTQLHRLFWFPFQSFPPHKIPFCLSLIWTLPVCIRLNGFFSANKMSVNPNGRYSEVRISGCGSTLGEHMFVHISCGGRSKSISGAVAIIADSYRANLGRNIHCQHLHPQAPVLQLLFPRRGTGFRFSGVVSPGRHDAP